MNARRMWVTLLFTVGCALSAGVVAQSQSTLEKGQQSMWDGEFSLSDVKKTGSQTMWTLALPSKRTKIATFFGYVSTDLCSYLTGEVGKRIADWDLRFVATAIMNENTSTFKAKSLISSVDDVPLVSTVIDKCGQLSSDRKIGTRETPFLIVTNHFVPGKQLDFALWTDDAHVLEELSAGWADLGTQSGGKWINKRFDWSRDTARPQVGDVVQATQRNHLYADYLRYREQFERWSGGPIITVIDSGDQFYVDAVRETEKGSVWAKIRPSVAPE